MIAVSINEPEHLLQLLGEIVRPNPRRGVEHFIGGISQHLGKSPVRLVDLAVLIEDDDAVLDCSTRMRRRIASWARASSNCLESVTSKTTPLICSISPAALENICPWQWSQRISPSFLLMR